MRESGKITIAVRVRPFSAREIALKDSYCAVNCRGENQIICTKKGLPPVVFPVDFAFCPFEGDACNFAKGNQHEVYNSLGLPLLNKALAGYNACLFTYGVT
uniref:Kinesin-like protein n=1 Tax=Mesocestoides corti TaxID=53468 RepID=A0A5K3FRW1_MESCO